MTAPGQTEQRHGALCDDIAGSGDATRAARTVVLVGNPNVGKSVISNLLTGSYVVVSNYPGTTIEIARGTGKVAGRNMEVIDTPGANALGPNSEEEKVARDVILEVDLPSSAGGRTIIQVADAKNLRRALFLTAQLAELEIPTVLALNMWDEAMDRGTRIDLARLRDEVGVPVIPTVATERRGLVALVRALDGATVPAFRPDYGEVIEPAIADVEKLLAGTVEFGRRGIALMLLAGDHTLAASLGARAGPGFAEALRIDREVALAGTGPADVELLYWAGAAWSGAIAADKRDLGMVAALPIAASLVIRTAELDDGFDGGAAHEFLLLYEAGRPGGALDVAEAHYRRALELSGDTSAGAHVGYAEMIAVARQDQAAFRRALEAALAVDPDAAPERRLTNVLAQRKARRLLEQVDLLFLDPEGGTS